MSALTAPYKVLDKKLNQPLCLSFWS